ncbi:MAG TPA: EAL domain-containing protein [Methylocella sp.]|nr:EAL domain-containing protein [Methylocella sp.]
MVESGKALSELPPESDKARLEEAVLLQLVRWLYQTPPFETLNLVNAILVAVVLRGLFPVTHYVIWIGLFFFIIFLRLLNRRRFSRGMLNEKTAAVWGWRFAAGAAATGTLWGVAAAAVLAARDPIHSTLIAFVAGGMSAGAVASDAAFLPALFGFIVPATLPVGLAFFARNDPASAAMGALIALFGAALCLIGIRANRWMHALARREIIARDLSAKLQVEIARQKTLENELLSNSRLSQAIARSAAEILRSFDLDRSIAKVLELTGLAMGAVFAHLYEREGTDSSALIARHMWHAPGVAPAGSTFRLILPEREDGQASAPSLLAEGKVQLISTAEICEPARSYFESCGMQSLLLVPVFAGAQLWGAAGIGNGGKDRAWSAVELNTLSILAELIGAAAAHARDLAEMADASRIVESSSTILYRIDPQAPHRLTYVSRNIGRFGYSQSELLSFPDRFLDLFHPEGRSRIAAGIASLISGRKADWNEDLQIRTPDGTFVWAENRMHPVRDNDGKLIALEGLISDIHSQKTAETETRRLTYTDHLTGLPNRIALMEWLHEAFAAASEKGNAFTILYLDLDNFRDINETMGHSTGDEVLKAVAKRLGGVLREGDRIAHVGGDEFIAILKDLGDQKAVAEVAAMLTGSVKEPHDVGGNEIHVTASAGISVYRSGLTRPEEMMREADLALYEAKERGRNKHIFHTEALDHAVRERVTMTEELRAALQRSEFEVYYQPQVEVPSQRITGVEALLRWNHPVSGLLTPGRFISVAEKSGLISPIGQWVLAEVRRQLRAWNSAGIAPEVTSVNLSAAQLSSPSDFLRDFMLGLTADGLDPGRIEMELTESLLMDAARGHRDVVNRLKALGVRIAIDDFGTGYSSLEYLLHHRVSRIKIAQQFVSRLPNDPASAAIVRATIILAREFDIDVVAEGVETADQLDFLVRSGCQRIQGFYFSQPLPAAQVTKLLRLGVIAAPAARNEAQENSSGE